MYIEIKKGKKYTECNALQKAKLAILRNIGDPKIDYVHFARSAKKN